MVPKLFTICAVSLPARMLRKAGKGILALLALAPSLHAAQTTPPSAAGASALPEAAASDVRTASAPPSEPRYHLVEEYTASVLEEGELKLGTDFDLGLSPKFMLGTDLVAVAVGVPTVQAKYLVWQNAEHQVALGFRAAYLSRKTLLWGNAKEHFDELDARIVRPQLAWTNLLSPRLRLHTFWAKGFGHIRAKLSAKGQRKLWETKHPGADYDTRDVKTQKPVDSSAEEAGEASPGEATSISGSENQEKQSAQQSSLTQQSIQAQSITGLAQERFQLTGEFTRKNGNKILVTSRIEQTELEKLKSNFFRLTAAHQWIWTNFQMRLGVGVQYYVMSGRDLDGEQIDAAGVQPASDIGFYWRF